MPAEDTTPEAKSVKRWTVPLLGLFIGQSILVAASFAAVILVLALQQSSQFEDAIHERVRLHLLGSSATISAPLLARELANDQITYRLKNDPDLWFGENMSLSSPNVQRFLNLTYAIVSQDPLMTAVNQAFRHPTKRTPNGYPLFGVIGQSVQGVSAVSNFDYGPETANGALQSGYPLNFATTLVGLPLPVTTEEWHMTQFVALESEWGKGTIFLNTVTNDITVTGGISTPLLLGHLDPDNVSSPIGGIINFAYSLDVTFLTQTAGDSLLSPNSKLLVYDSLSEYIMTSRNTGAGNWNVPLNTHWVLDTFPDQALVASFRKYRDRAPCTNTSCGVFIDAKAGDDMVTLLQVQTPRGFRMQVFQLTPRSYFFAAGERSIAIGVSIGVVAAALVLVSCILIWLAVRGPVRHLQNGMDLAARMRNDEVQDTGSHISEINALATTFHHMNRRLLQARAFMPQALLMSSPVDSVEDEEDSEWSADEGEIEMDDRRSSVNHMALGLNKPPSMSDSRSVVSSHRSQKNRTDPSAQVNVMRGGLTMRKVSVLTVNARGTHEVCKRGPAALELHETRLVQHIEASVVGEKGVVDSFQGDHFVVTFNAARSVGTPERNAAMAALAISEGSSVLQFSMGISAGKVYVGNVGTATMKKHCTVGTAFSNAMALEQLARSSGWACLSHGRCLAEAVYSVDFMMLGYGSLVSGSEDTVCAVIQANNRALAKDTEWMYAVQGGTDTTTDPFSAYNAAFNLCLAGDFATAAATLPAQLTPAEEGDQQTSPRSASDSLSLTCETLTVDADVSCHPEASNSLRTKSTRSSSTLLHTVEVLRKLIASKSTSTSSGASQRVNSRSIASLSLSSPQLDVVSEALAILLTSEILHQAGPRVRDAMARGGQRNLGFHLGKPHINPGQKQAPITE